MLVCNVGHEALAACRRLGEELAHTYVHIIEIRTRRSAPALADDLSNRDKYQTLTPLLLRMSTFFCPRQALRSGDLQRRSRKAKGRQKQEHKNAEDSRMLFDRLCSRQAMGGRVSGCPIPRTNTYCPGST
jgi:hypothetical protein